MKRILFLTAIIFLALALPAGADSNTGISYGSELLTNPGFESGTTGWSTTNATLTQDSSHHHSGSYSGKLAITSNGQGSLYQAPSTSSGTWYRGYVWGDNASSSWQWRLNLPGYVTIQSPWQTNNGTWAQVTITNLCTGSSTQIQADNYGNAANYAYFDDFSLMAMDTKSLFFNTATAANNPTVSVKITNSSAPSLVQGGLVMNLDSATNPQNYLIACYANIYGDAIMLVKCVGGTVSVVGYTNITYVSGAVLQVQESGTTYKTYYNGSLLRTDTISGLSTYTGCGEFATDASVTLSNFSYTSPRSPVTFYVNSTTSIYGSVTSGSLGLGDVLVQAGTGARAINGGTGGTNTLLVSVYSGTPDGNASHTWQDWGPNGSGVFTPNGTAPVANGSDSYDGMEQTHTTGNTGPWQTANAVNNNAQVSGDSYLFICNGARFETLLPPASGIVSNYITYSSYGSGFNPRFYGALPVLPGLTTNGGDWTKTGGYNYVYQTSFGPGYDIATQWATNNWSSYGAIWVNGNGDYLDKKTSIAAVDGTAGTCYYDSTNHIMYVHAYDNNVPSQLYWISIYGNGILTQGNSYLIFSNFDPFYHGLGSIATELYTPGTYGSYNSITGCNVWYSTADGFAIGGYNHTVAYCTANYQKEKAFSAQNYYSLTPTSGISFVGCINKNNASGPNPEWTGVDLPIAFIDDSQIAGGTNTTWTDCLNTAWVKIVYAGNAWTNPTINGIVNTGTHSIVLDLKGTNIQIFGFKNLVNPTTPNYTINATGVNGLRISRSYFTFDHTVSTGLAYLSSLSGTIQWDDVIIDGNGGGNGIYAVPSSTANNYYNLTIYGVGNAITHTADSTTTIKNCITRSITGANYTCSAGKAHLTSDYNCSYGGSTSWAADTGQDSHSVTGDPKLANGSGSFNTPSDFLLGWGSSCINKGTLISGITQDYFGNIIPSGGGQVDIGAHQLNRSGGS